jgi:hypothetical protein
MVAHIRDNHTAVSRRLRSKPSRAGVRQLGLAASFSRLTKHSM